MDLIEVLMLNAKLAFVDPQIEASFSFHRSFQLDLGFAFFPKNS